MAVADACRQLRTRLVPLAAEILQYAEADVSFKDCLVHGSAGRSIPFPTLTPIGNMRLRDDVDAATDDEKLILIRAHPDLAGKLARSGALTDGSRTRRRSQ